jgi:exodeoxyribonuclease VII small subunit
MPPNPWETAVAASSNSRACLRARHRRPARNHNLIAIQRLFEMPARWRIFPGVEAKDTKLSFEAALGKLESIVESMESGDVPLAELLARAEDGSRLLKVCESRLKDAELKIEQLKKQKDGKVAFEKFEIARED